MNLADDLFPIRIRSLQADFPDAHAALCNWAAWSRDPKGIYPAEIAPQRIWDEYQSSKWTADEVDERADVVDQVEVKAERAEKEPYDDLKGWSLDARINEPGLISQEVRTVLVIAYGVRGYTLEGHYCRRAGCSQDAFCERLEAGLRFASRFC